VAFLGIGSPADAIALLARAKETAGGAVEAFELMGRLGVDFALKNIAGTRDPLAEVHPWYVLAEFEAAEAGAAETAMERFLAEGLEAVLAHVPGSRSPLGGSHEWHALIELTADAARASALPQLAEDLLASAFEAGLVEDATIAANEAQAEQFWLIRDEISPAERALGPAMQHDISVPVARMADFVAAAVPQLEARFPGTQAIAFGHLGDGNVHFHVLAPSGAARGEWEAGEGKAISHYVHDLVTQWGGSISAEHGIGQLKVDDLARLGDPVQLAMMRAVKRALDPQGLLNPGKLVPPCT
jgi:FAD/FMN-containing dehydrogenase